MCAACDSNCVTANGCSTNGAGNCDTACKTGYYLDSTFKCKGEYVVMTTLHYRH